MKKIAIIVLASALSFFTSCSNKKRNSDTLFQCPMDCENGTTYKENKPCPICNMELKEVGVGNKIIADENEISEASIFNLTSKWNTQNNEVVELKDFKGNILVIVMIYTTCKAACPRLIADMRNIASKVNDESIKYVMVSIDPETDTPEKLKAFAIENNMDNEQWVFLQGNVDDVREFSNVLSVKYKQISPLDFSHSNIISVFNRQGVLVHQQEGLGINNEETVSEIIELTK